MVTPVGLYISSDHLGNPGKLMYIWVVGIAIACSFITWGGKRGLKRRFGKGWVKLNNRRPDGSNFRTGCKDGGILRALEEGDEKLSRYNGVEFQKRT